MPAARPAGMLFAVKVEDNCGVAQGNSTQAPMQAGLRAQDFPGQLATKSGWVADTASLAVTVHYCVH